MRGTLSHDTCGLRHRWCFHGSLGATGWIRILPWRIDGVGPNGGISCCVGGRLTSGSGHSTNSGGAGEEDTSSFGRGRK